MPDQFDMQQVAGDLVAALEGLARRRVEGGPPVGLTARQVAERFALRPHGSADSRKRAVRLVVDHAREVMGRRDLLSSFDRPDQAGRDPEGRRATVYYIAACAADYQAALERSKTTGLAHLRNRGEVARSEQLADANGQHLMFAPVQSTPRTAGVVR